MDYKYHIQYQAIERANAILPVPEDYPLKSGITDKFRAEFSQLCELVKNIYLDIAENPEVYGLPLIDAYEQNGKQISWGPIGASSRSLYKPVEMLYILSCSGKMDDCTLRVHIQTFKDNIKKGKFTGYNLILNRLTYVGFIFEGYTEKGFAKGNEYFTVSFPSNPEIMKTLKAYCDCRETIEKEYVREDRSDFERSFHICDYKYTADLVALPGIVWAKDKTHSWDDEAKTFYVAFYEQAVKIQKIKYSGDFYKGSKTIAKLRYEDDLWKQDVGYFTNSEYRDIITRGMKTYFALILYLPIKGDKNRFNSLPSHLIEYMKSKKCQDCNAFAGQKAKNDGKCTHTVEWSHNGQEYRSCSYYCFHFENPRVEDISAYCSLL